MNKKYKCTQKFQISKMPKNAPNRDLIFSAIEIWTRFLYVLLVCSFITPFKDNCQIWLSDIEQLSINIVIHIAVNGLILAIFCFNIY